MAAAAPVNGGSFLAPPPAGAFSPCCGSSLVVQAAPVVSRARSPVPLQVQAVRRLPFAPSKRSLIQAKQKPRSIPVEIETIPNTLLPLGKADVRPWLEAAKTFDMNTDFDISSALQRVSGCRKLKLDLAGLMALMKEESSGKMTIQALADKLLLHKLVAHMGIPQMPAMMSINHAAQAPTIQREVEHMVFSHLCSSESSDIVLKPTHLSNGKGVVIVSPIRLDGEDYAHKIKEVDSTIKYLVVHIENHLREQAGAHESVALRTLQPGFIAQPKYQSVVGFKTPLELRVVVLWGKARLALWWWGRGAAPDEFPNRNAWLVRRPAQDGELSEQDSWEVVHEHSGSNQGFDRAVALFRKHISAIATTAEALAVAVGAPFLRADFFVGSPQYGVRLNEVAYGCGVDYKNRVQNESSDWEGRIVDDAPAIAHILQEGMAYCKSRQPPEHFLSRLGAEGTTYRGLAVSAVSSGQDVLMPDCPIGRRADGNCEEFVVPEDLCSTRPNSFCPALSSVQNSRFSAWAHRSPRCGVGARRVGCGPALAPSPARHQPLQAQLRSRSFHAPRAAEVVQRYASFAPPRATSFNSALCKLSFAPAIQYERRVIY